MRWKASTSEMKKYNPFSPASFASALSRVTPYVNCMKQCGEHWLGLRFHYLNLWMPHSVYHLGSKLSKATETKFWQALLVSKGFRLPGIDSQGNYCLSNLH